jgi:hypothetical protein
VFVHSGEGEGLCYAVWGGSLCCFVRSSNFEVTLRLTVSQSVYLGVEHSCGMLLSEICCLVSVRVPSLTRGRLCNLQCNDSMVRVAPNP